MIYKRVLISKKSIDKTESKYDISYKQRQIIQKNSMLITTNMKSWHLNCISNLHVVIFLDAMHHPV